MKYRLNFVPKNAYNNFLQLINLIIFVINRFQKEEDIRKQWLAFCGINKHVLNTVTKLCANHFREKDMIKKVKRSYIKPNTVPSIYGKKKKRSLQFDSFNYEIYSKKKKEYIATDSVNVDCNILIKGNND